MKPIYFATLAPPRVAPALCSQAHESFRPFVSYLMSAKAAARSREARSVCHWEPVPIEHTLRLAPLDTIVEILPDGFAYHIPNWQDPAPPMPLFIGRDFRPVQPRRIEASPSGLTIWLDVEVGPEEPVYWAARQCQLVATAIRWPERLVLQRPDGTLAILRRREEADGRLRLITEGTAPVAVLSETGSRVLHRILEPSEGVTRARDGKHEFSWSGTGTLTTAALPDADFLTSDNGVRWSWEEEGGRRGRRRGVWIQLLAPDDMDGDAMVDARAAYCEEGVREVRTQKGGDPRHGYRVLSARRESYRLELDRLPPEGKAVFLPANIAGLQRQLQAVHRLKDSPLPHHRGLLKLCETPEARPWKPVQRHHVDRWFILDDERWDGTKEQRELVEKALGTPDFAFLEGPPGSGKTHAICELVLQLLEKNQRVLLCSTTHVAVDNVLERLVGKFPQVEAVRIGRTERVDPRVRDCQLDQRVEQLTHSWRDRGIMTDLDERALAEVAESTVLAGSNLTCGTTTGILAHPYIRRADDGNGGPRWPHFNILILDEASKTTLQEFLVPAQLACSWIIVGDVQQLPPFSEPRDLEASLAEINHETGTRLPDAHQRACFLLFRLSRPEAGRGQIRWLIEERPEVLDALVEEILARRARGDAALPEVVRITGGPPVTPLDVPVADLLAMKPSALRVLGADWVLCTHDCSTRVWRAFPLDLVPLVESDDAAALAYRRAWWSDRHGKLRPPIQEQRRKHELVADVRKSTRHFLAEESWARQVAWRLGRVHQLGSAHNDRQREHRQREVDALLPAAAPFAEWVPHAVDAIRDVGVRSVIEALRVRRVDHRVRRKSALTEAIPAEDWADRAVRLTRQHRMHPDISVLPRELFYDGEALRDANTLTGRDERVGWSFQKGAPGRRLWVDVDGREDRGTNPAEVDAMRRLLVDWREHAGRNPRKDHRPWEVACLSFYNRQELAIRDMLRRLTGLGNAETRFDLAGTNVVCGTVDRFQGREADLVLLSLRNTSRAGHMDSPNRLNVGITRARFMLVIFGHRRYFAERCPSEELAGLAQRTPVLVLGGRT